MCGWLQGQLLDLQSSLPPETVVKLNSAACNGHGIFHQLNCQGRTTCRQFTPHDKSLSLEDFPEVVRLLLGQAWRSQDYLPAEVLPAPGAHPMMQSAGL